MNAYTLIMCMVPHNCGEIVTTAARQAGSPGGTVLMARGFSSSTVLHMLSLGERWVDAVWVLVPSDDCQRICQAIKEATHKKRRRFGIMFTVDDVSTLFKSGADAAEKCKEEDEVADRQLITIIANKGYADDIMAAARDAGARGGTVVNARGTARPGDSKFFGMEIVPEKDMLFILTYTDKMQPILDAIKSLPCLAKPGSGIAFTMGASNFTSLGKQ